jgi:DNA-binding GntR family transcriptional regulator
MQRALVKKAPLALEGSIASKALYEEVAGRLRQSIFSQDLAPGAWIDEQALAQAYGISRTPLREALKVLASEGLVILKPRRGCYVVQVSRREVEEVFAVLALLEGQCAYEAMGKAQPEDLQRLETLHEQLELRTTEKYRAEWFEINQEFHRVLHEMSGNNCMLHVIGNLRKVMKLVRYHALLRGGRLEECFEEHSRIMGAIRRRDPAAVKDSVQAHLLSCGRAISEIYSSRSQPENGR